MCESVSRELLVGKSKKSVRRELVWSSKAVSSDFTCCKGLNLKFRPAFPPPRISTSLLTVVLFQNYARPTAKDIYVLYEVSFAEVPYHGKKKTLQQLSSLFQDVSQIIKDFYSVSDKLV